MSQDTVYEKRVRSAFYRIQQQRIKVGSISELLSYTGAAKLAPVPEIFFSTSNSPSVKKLLSEINHYIEESK
jgi:hypothetical protein